MNTSLSLDFQSFIIYLTNTFTVVDQLSSLIASYTLHPYTHLLPFYPQRTMIYRVQERNTRVYTINLRSTSPLESSRNMINKKRQKAANRESKIAFSSRRRDGDLTRTNIHRVHGMDNAIVYYFPKSESSYSRNLSGLKMPMGWMYSYTYSCHNSSFYSV